MNCRHQFPPLHQESGYHHFLRRVFIQLTPCNIFNYGYEFGVPVRLRDTLAVRLVGSTRRWEFYTALAVLSIVLNRCVFLFFFLIVA